MHKKSRNYQNVGKQDLVQKTEVLDSRDNFKLIVGLGFLALKCGKLFFFFSKESSPMISIMKPFAHIIDSLYISSIFCCNTQSLFSPSNEKLKNTKMGDQLLILTYFNILDF